MLAAGAEWALGEGRLGDIERGVTCEAGGHDGRLEEWEMVY